MGNYFKHFCGLGQLSLSNFFLYEGPKSVSTNSASHQTGNYDASSSLSCLRGKKIRI